MAAARSRPGSPDRQWTSTAWVRFGVPYELNDSEWRRGLASAHDAAVQMIDTSIVRVHQHEACIAKNREQHMGRSRGGLTSKVQWWLTPTDCLCGPVLPGRGS
jgi:hypothetical protein